MAAVAAAVVGLAVLRQLRPTAVVPAAVVGLAVVAAPPAAVQLCPATTPDGTPEVRPCTLRT